MSGAAGVVAGAVAPALITFGLDQLFNALEPNPVVEKNQRLESIKLTEVVEGTPLPVCYGSSVRVSGTILFVSDIIEEKNVEQVGGKGFSDNAETSITYSNFVDIFVAVCEGEISNVSRIWANSELIYANLPAVVMSSNVISVTVRPTITAIPIAKMEIRSHMSFGGPDLRRLTPGFPVLVEGFANAANNGTFMCVKSGQRDYGGGEIDTYAILKNDNFGGPVEESSGAGVGLQQHATGFPASSMVSLDQYNGDLVQGFDPLLEEYHNKLGIPPVAYRGIAYVAMGRLRLDGSFGTSLPQFSFEVVPQIQSIQAIIYDIMIRRGYDPSEFDVSNISGIVGGYSTNVVSLQDALKPLMIAHDLTASIEDSNKLVFRSRTGLSTVTLDGGEVSAHEENESEFVRGIQTTEVIDARLPREVVVDYIDPATDYQPGSQRERRVADVETENSVKLSLPVVMSVGQARAIAGRELHRAWLNKSVIELTLSPRYLKLREHMMISTIIDDRIYKIFITKIERGFNYLVKVTGVIDV